ncbi:MFS transporter [Pseudonocardia lacus]|uniref:MFS transporter n=1 Tax=Pseudonocardia lacus TaxID=2835865 RepID=UPI001BDC9324|nr:MFS transporter [Pseudonocardia lacus]
MASSRPPAVLAVAEFRAIWLAELLSLVGDQLARVALAVLVFGRTGSASLAALSYALTFLPALVGGVALGGLADRFRRREVMVAADALRAVTVAVMALPGMPLWLLCVLLVLVVLAAAPHTAAQGALLPQVLPGHLYERGLAVRQITGQTAQLAGFSAGGLLVAAFTPEAALLVNAGTFVLSGLLVRLGVAARDRPAARARAEAGRGGRGLVGVVAEIAADPVRRALVLLAWLVGCYVVPEALAAPYAAQIGAGPAVVGLLMAADPLGSVLGAWLFVRFVPPARRARLVGVLAVVAGLPLLPFALRPDVPVAVVLLAVSGMASTAYLLQAQAGFVLATPDGNRGRAIGVAASGIVAGQGVAVLVGGLLADAWGAGGAITAGGAAGAVLALGGAVLWHRACRAGSPAATRAVAEG